MGLQIHMPYHCSRGLFSPAESSPRSAMNWAQTQANPSLNSHRFFHTVQVKAKFPNFLPRRLP